jgi:hypothetical protein
VDEVHAPKSRISLAARSPQKPMVRLMRIDWCDTGIPWSP